MLVLVAFAPRAFAHQTSVKYIDLTIRDAHTIDVSLRCAATDVTEPLGLPADAKPTVRDALAQAARVAPFVQHWLALTGCTASAPVASAFDASFIAVTWTEACPATAEVGVDLSAFFAIDQRHEAIVQLAAPGAQTVNTIARADTPHVTLRPGHAPSLLAWIRTGMDHIYTGTDHICFVLALLLVVMLQRDARGNWQRRAFVPTLRSTAVVITAFTIAHSISLIAAALGYVALPSRFVESMIALSIAYTAAEDIIRPDVRWRYALTFGFGLVHGLGFAATLAELLPPRSVVIPLLCFNVGVEIGQLSVVLVALPVFYAIARAAGGDRYRRIALPALAGLIFAVGLTMFAERLLGIRILPM